MCKGTTKIPKPKVKMTGFVFVTQFYNFPFLLQPKTITHREAVQYLVKYDHVTMYVGNGNICLECDSDFEEHSHFT